jgi:hypothetical protein
MAVQHHLWWVAIPGLVGALGFFLVTLYSFGPGTARRVRRMYGEGKNRGLLGERQIELTDEGLIVRSEVGESKINWEGIEKISHSNDHTFVYTSALTAIIIPRKGIVAEDYERFVRALQEKCPSVNTGIQRKTGEGKG